MVEQTMIPGTADVPTARVADVGEIYVEALGAWQAQQKIADSARAVLITAMEEDQIEHFILSNHDITLRTTATTKVAVKTLSEPEEN